MSQAGPRCAAEPAPAPAAGGGRALAAAYAVFTLAAGARSAVQLSTEAGRAPLAYALSALAAVTYLAATLALRHGSPRALRLARWVALGEFAGVVGVGAWSVLDPARFPDETVWSQFGAGYGCVPLVLPLLALAWLRRSRATPATRPGFASPQQSGRGTWG